MKKLFLLLTLLSLAACQPENKSIHGYIEGEFVLLAPTTGGLLKTLSVERGQEVKADDSRGTINLFPSYCMHRVGPMVKGERWALVIWVHGSKRFK